MALLSLAGFCCKERVLLTVREPSVIEGFKVMFRNKPLMLIVCGNIIGTLSGLAGVFQTYYLAEVININSLMLLIGLPGTLIGWATYLVIPKLKKRFDNRQIVFLNGITRIVVASLVFIIGFRHFDSVKVVLPLLMIRNAIFSFFDTINSVVPTEMIGDTIDYMEWKTGERNEGVSFSVLTFIGKLTGSVSTSVATALLPVIGLTYVNVNGTQTTVMGEHTDAWIWAFYSFIPYLVGALGLIPYFWYDLTGDKLKRIRSELEIRHNELSKKVSGGEGVE
jgi:GPH family glycoside/pentoside/hexuronide:cation symporter/probable glucitol transport protein GutA